MNRSGWKRATRARSLAALSAASFLASILSCIATQAHADLVLETETAQLGKKGEFNFSNALQYEHAPDGNAILTETQYEYGIDDRTEILIEPFFYQWNSPNVGRHDSGIGDTEVTLSHTAITETSMRPSLILAQKIKIPTATNDNIGSGKFDATSYIIVGKTWDMVHLNANLGYEYIGKVPGADLKDQVIYDLSIDFPAGPKTTLFVEGFGNTTAEQGGKGTQAAGAGIEYQFAKHYNVFSAVATDTDHATVVRVGLNYGF